MTAYAEESMLATLLDNPLGSLHVRDHYTHSVNSTEAVFVLLLEQIVVA